MKKILLVLLATAAISPAMAKESAYKLANPLYRPTAKAGVIGGEISYARQPKDLDIPQEKAESYRFVPEISYGLTDKLAFNAAAGYGRAKGKSGVIKGDRANEYSAKAGISYLIASAEGFDFNVNADFLYEKERTKIGGASRSRHHSGVDVGLLVGKKIDKLTPYFGIGFESDLWSSRWTKRGTETYINPGIYIDLCDKVALDLNYESITHGDAPYKGIIDFYPQDNVVVGVGAFMVHPETDTNQYGGLANIKVKF